VEERAHALNEQAGKFEKNLKEREREWEQLLRVTKGDLDRTAADSKFRQGRIVELEGALKNAEERFVKALFPFVGSVMCLLSLASVLVKSVRRHCDQT
jgi:hypothetical protein